MSSEIQDYEKILLDDLNKEQRAAVLYDQNPLRIIASAGSGKTKVLTRKVAHLILVNGVPSSRILAITFTNKAASEMKTRINTYVDVSQNVMAMTFHAICSRILRHDINKLGRSNDFYVLDKRDQKDILKRIYNSFDLNDDILSYSDMNDFIQVVKIKNLNVDDLEKQNVDNKVEKLKIKVYREYNKILIRSNSLDFHDLLIWTKKLFDEISYIKEKWSNRFDYVLVDEFQDTNQIQFDIVKVLASNAHITIVGDPDQTIYSWRGANMNIMLNFEAEFKNTKTITLAQNYRSTKKILSYANKLIKHNKNRLDKTLYTENEEGESANYFHAFSVDAEATWVIKRINELKKEKNQLKSIAIFYRSNFYSRSFEEALIRENINHRVFGGERFFERKEVKDALAFLRVIYDGNNISFLRIINTPSRKIGSSTIEKLREYAVKNNSLIYDICIKNINKADFPVTGKTRLALFNLLKLTLKYRKSLESNSINVVLDKFLEEVKYYEDISERSNLRGSAIDNIKELLRSIEEWIKKNPKGKVQDYLENVSLLSSTMEDENVNNYISLMTIHAAKGLQFDNVFIVGFSDQIFPSIRSLEADNFSSPKQKLEEERRLAYVAITRAKKRLFLSDSRGLYLNTNSLKIPSRFLKEMGIPINKYLSVTSPIDGDLDVTTETIIERDINIGDIISHSAFGEGNVIDIMGETIKVKFNNKKYGVKQLMKAHSSYTILKKAGQNE